METDRGVRGSAAALARRSRLTAAWQASRLAETPDSFRDALLDHASESSVGAGEIIRWDGPLLVVVMSGQACVHLTSVDRRAAMRYLRRGEMVGLVTVFLPALAPTRIPMVIRALTACTIMKLPPKLFATLAQRDGKLAWRVGQWIADDMVTGHAVLADDIFLSVRQLLARHLLDLAVAENGRLIVYATQQDLADAIGSVRAVVGRSISELRSEGLLVRDGRAMRLTDPVRLGKIASAE
ncbi:MULTISPECIES: Crp/Fnr family transcriptional regulator [unclassified Mycobacterium]|uniref:Crp/Fnr family transcriptional regulator n=1 Tax=unclassified Mycobacterium TaxID=2642494 RepID=UPI0029C66DA8|nr:MULTISPECIES: Crp/Fnr family transcriptional regulator [unclassified Mycobacterium]